MVFNLKRVCGRAFCALLLLMASSNLFASDQIAVGQPFPQLVLPQAETGQPLSIRHFRGEKVILHIWASW